MKDILDEIIAHKRVEIENQKRSVSVEFLKSNIKINEHYISMSESLLNSPTGIIAEFKRRSPSKGWIKENASADIIPAEYEKAGASAVSILTNEEFFGGSLKDIRTARKNLSIPILRKEFIIDEYQIYQASIVGADAILLIASALDYNTYKKLLIKAHELNLEVLLEIHNENELDYITDDVDMVGINNRNLGTFKTDIDNSFKLASMLPKNMVLVSESGILSPETVIELRDAGFNGFLIGETFMKTDDPALSLKQFIEKINKK